MTNIGMSCNGCSFEKGSDCSIGILENIKNESNTCELVDGHYQFDRICPHKNDQNFTEEDSFNNITVPVSFIIVDTDLEKTEGLIKKIRGAISIHWNYTICISTMDNFKSLKKYADINNEVLVIRSFSEGKGDRIRDCFLKVKNGYSVIVESTEEVNADHITKLNMFINKKMKRVGLISDSPMIVNNVLFKYLKGNKAVSYEEKLNSLSEEQNVSTMVYTWKEVNEAIDL